MEYTSLLPNYGPLSPRRESALTYVTYIFIEKHF